MAASSQDERLDRWWTPPELAIEWRCSPGCARKRLRAIDKRQGGQVLVTSEGGHVKVWGRTLEAAVAGSLSRTVGGQPMVSVLDVRQLYAEVVEMRGRLDQTDEWREQFEPKLQRFATG